MSTKSGIKGIVEASIRHRISNNKAWPKNLLRLELECLEKKKEEQVTNGIYQDKTGKILEGMKRAGEVDVFEEEINESTHSFISEPGCSEIGNEVRERFKRVDDFLQTSGHFGALIAYVALCKVWEELDNTHVEVMPEGSYEVLYHTDRKPDAFVSYPNEYIPVEVYNGRDYLDTPGSGYQSEKHNQLRDYAETPQGHSIDCSPFLICRRSTDDLQAKLRQWDGMGIDTDCIIACEAHRTDIEDDLDFFDISESFEFISKVQAPDGTLMDGETYKNAGADSPHLRPTSDIAEQATDIPPFYMQRVRGGIQLHYVNSYYRRRHDTVSTHACRVVQTLYNQLLRQGGKNKQTAISDAWDETSFRDSVSDRESIIKDEANEIVNNLSNKRIIYRRQGKIYARKAKHPQQDLVFNV